MTRRTLATLALAATGLVLVAGAATEPARARAAVAPALVWSPATFVISGHGWGHGVGLSQYGAYGFSKNGYSYDRIVSHYYPGTELEQGATGTIRVLLASRASLTISSASAFSVTDASGVTGEVADLSLTLDSSLSVNLADGQSVTLTAPLVFKAGSSASPLSYAGRSYRGTFRVLVLDGTLRLINVVGLEPYLYGVVPCESPHDWPADALQAQAVVARSYALASIRPSSTFDVYADTRSQVYQGRAHEYPETTAAVQATAGEAVYYDGEIAKTFFFSTSGGRTSAIQDAWPKAQPLPYLVSVKDPYDDLSPYHNWGPVVLSSQKLAKKLKIVGPISNLTTKINGSQRVSIATLTGAGGATYTLTGDEVKAALGLRSAWFRATVLALQRPKKALLLGTKARVLARARGAAEPALEKRPSGGSWARVRALPRRGLFTLVLKPTVTTYYRIVDGDATGTSVRFAVAPRVRLYQTATGGFRGTVRPRKAGATVHLQRLQNGAWKKLARIPLKANGSFIRKGELRAGQYRVRVSGISGLVPGFSPIVDTSY